MSSLRTYIVLICILDSNMQDPVFHAQYHNKKKGPGVIRKMKFYL